jgi:hypothetical protein
MIAFLVVTPGVDEEWVNTRAAADEVAARHLHAAPEAVDELRRQINVDPLVVRHDGARWRSRQVWNIRSASRTVRVYEMLRIDEAVYEH